LSAGTTSAPSGEPAASATDLDNDFEDVIGTSVAPAKPLPVINSGPVVEQAHHRTDSQDLDEMIHSIAATTADKVESLYAPPEQNGSAAAAAAAHDNTDDVPPWATSSKRAQDLEDDDVPPWAMRDQDDDVPPWATSSNNAQDLVDDDTAPWASSNQHDDVPAWANSSTTNDDVPAWANSSTTTHAQDEKATNEDFWANSSIPAPADPEGAQFQPEQQQPPQTDESDRLSMSSFSSQSQQVDQIACPSCRRKNDADANFCSKCGNKFAKSGEMTPSQPASGDVPPPQPSESPAPPASAGDAQPQYVAFYDSVGNLFYYDANSTQARFFIIVKN